MNRRAHSAVALVGAALAIASVNTIAEESDTAISWGTGLEYSSGKYGGTEDIEDLYMPIHMRVGFDRVSIKLTVPYLSVRAPDGTTELGPDGEVVPGSGEVSTESGLGDVVAGITLYDLIYSENHSIALDLTGNIKFGTADEDRGLGTGENDFTLRADLYKFYDRFVLMGSAGYKVRGDPSGVDLDNVWLGSVGGVYSISDASQIGMAYGYRESAIVDSDAVSELSLFLTRRINDSWGIQLYGFAGFGDSSADWGAGVYLQIG